MAESTVVIKPSALKHGISEARIRYVVATCPLPLDNPIWPGQTMYLAPDQHGNPLEVMGYTDDEGITVVIHAMKLRPDYEDTYAEVTRHR